MDIGDTYRPLVHFTALKNWLNDPNGWSYYNGEYHLFYQHNPYSVEWGNMSWGHAITKDFVHWRHLPLAMVRDQDYDASGVFSGSAIVEDNKHYLLYTGVANEQFDYEQSQCMAVSQDGINYTKYTINPVLRPNGKTNSLLDYRDPKLWKTGSNYTFVLSTKDDKGGKVEVYNMTSLEEPTAISYRGAFQNEGFGYMWECPDYFELDGQGIMIFSVMGGGHALGYREDNLTYIGNVPLLDTLEEGFNEPIKAIELMDYGTDFYAPQSMVTPDHRRLVIGWLRMQKPMANSDWTGMMTVPREITLRDNTIYYQPCQEILDVFQQPVKAINGSEDTYSYHNSAAYKIDCKGSANRDMAIYLKSQDQEAYEMPMMQIDYASEQDSVIVTVHGEGGESAIYKAPIHNTDEEQMTILLDRSVIEVYINGGRSVISVASLLLPMSGELHIDAEEWTIMCYDGKEGWSDV